MTQVQASCWSRLKLLRALSEQKRASTALLFVAQKLLQTWLSIPGVSGQALEICLSAEALTYWAVVPYTLWLTHGDSLQAWARSRQWTTISYLQRAICRTLREAGLEVQMEYNEGFFSVDTALFLPPQSLGGRSRKVRPRESAILCCCVHR